MIGITSGISFARFFFYLFPVSLISTIALIAVVYFFYRKAFNQSFEGSSDPPGEVRSYDSHAIKRLTPVLVLVLIAFFVSSVLKLKMPLIALSSAALMLLAGNARPSNILKIVNGVLLIFFAGLFTVIEGAHKAGVLDVFVKRIVFSPDLSGIAYISVISTLVSQLVSNVPLTMLLLPVLKDIPGDVLWVALAAGSTLGGNMTIIGAVANIIVVEEAAKDGVQIRFMEFLKVGLAVTVVTISLGILILGIEYNLGWLR